jgi:hypothetical protein
VLAGKRCPQPWTVHRISVAKDAGRLARHGQLPHPTALLAQLCPFLTPPRGRESDLAGVPTAR